MNHDRQQPNVLICNDDGIHAPGIQCLKRAVDDLCCPTVVAPTEEQSAVGHAITVFKPVTCKRVMKDDSFFGYAVGGTPADCVKLGVGSLLNTEPDFVLSGVNLGSNTGISVIYSGTVSGATEGTILGIPSIAFSLTSYSDPYWETAEHAVRAVTKMAFAKGLPAGCLLNVNIPNLPLDSVKGFKITRMGHSRWIEKFHERQDPRGNTYYWLDGEMKLLSNGRDSDVEAVEDGFISITPIGLDLTHQAAIDPLSEWPLRL